MFSKLLTGLILLLSFATMRAQSVTDDQFIEATLYPATVLLFSQNSDGGMRMRCTATAYAHQGDTYHFATAAHCIVDDEGKILPDAFFVSEDEPGHKDYLPAEVHICGDRDKGNDFCDLTVKTKDSVFPIVGLGKDPTSIAGEPVINIASPLGLGKQTFIGRVSKPKVDRVLVSDDINWTGAILLQLPGTAGGSSGSAIICERQHAICGFLVGIQGAEMFAIPVSRFSAFLVKGKTEKPDVKPTTILELK
jgi:hypothetical protein